MGNIHSEYKGIRGTFVLLFQGKFATLNSIMGDMSVTVGGSKCTITSLTEDTLVCEPPQTPQLVDGGGYASVMVSWNFLPLNSIMGDMSVTVGGSKCTITSLTEDTLVCEPPQTPQLVDGGGYASVMVSWDKNLSVTPNIN